MPRLNKSRLRPDVLKIVLERQKLQVQSITEYVRQPENQNFDFRVLWKKVMAGNVRFFESRGRDGQLGSIVSREEMLWLARLHRFTSRYVAEATQQKWPLPKNTVIEPVVADSVTAEWQSFPSAARGAVLLYFHGGGWILDSPYTHRSLTTAIGRTAGTRVLSVDYRLAPEHRHPAHLEDCVACYKCLLSNKVAPGNIVVAGDSAGGNLTLATLLYLRDNRIPLPAGAVLISPSTDLTHSDETYFANGATDPILADSGVFWWKTAYAGDLDLTNPLISPLRGDMAGLPPLLFQVSTSEMLYGETRRCAEKAGNAGVDVTLETWDDMLHVFQQFGLHRLKEADEALAGIGAFIQRVAQIR